MKKLFIILIVFLIYSCSKKQKESIDYFNDINDSSFISFYKNYFNDSIYQIEHTQFPLEGAYYEYDIEKKWKKEKWYFLKNLPSELDTSLYNIQLKKENERVIEDIELKESGFSIQFQYQKIKEKWHLVYYDENNY